ncbi:hypothetical protein [Terasakiella sp.]
MTVTNFIGHGGAYPGGQHRMPSPAIQTKTAGPDRIHQSNPAQRFVVLFI